MAKSNRNASVTLPTTASAMFLAAWESMGAPMLDFIRYGGQRGSSGVMSPDESRRMAEVDRPKASFKVESNFVELEWIEHYGVIGHDTERCKLMFEVPMAVQVANGAKRYAVAYFAEFREPIDTTLTDWDSTAWADFSHRLNFESEAYERMHELFCNTLEAETLRLAEQAESE